MAAVRRNGELKMPPDGALRAIDITNLQLAQTEKDNARTSYLQTLRQYWAAYYQLRRSTLYDFIASPDGLALASAFSGIKDQTVRRRVIDLLRSLSD